MTTSIQRLNWGSEELNKPRRSHGPASWRADARSTRCRSTDVPSFLSFTSTPPDSHTEMASSSSSADPSAPSSASSPTILQFTPLPTQISADFWHTLSTLKLDRLRLDEAPLPLKASYGIARRVKDRSTGEEVAVQGSLVLDEASLDAGGDAMARNQSGGASSGWVQQRVKGASCMRIC